MMNIQFFINSSLLGVGVAMDAFSVSIANGLTDPQMTKRKLLSVSGLFSFFQAIMPLIGWFCIHSVLKRFSVIAEVVPWVAFVLLLFFGGQMIYEGAKSKNEHTKKILNIGGWVIQAIATSIDALSVGFTIASYNLLMAVISSMIIFLIAFIICVIGFFIGKKFGSVLSNKATIFGGVILIIIGIEILIVNAI